jgi:hypothetical protein
MNIYLRKHGEDKAVKDLWDNIRPSGISGIDWLFTIEMERQMRPEVDRRKKADWLGEWLRPQFTTSNNFGPHSRPSIEGAVATVLMMSSPTESSQKIDPFPCANGMPSVTLFGEQKDW